MNELEATLSLMKDAETSYRGYILTNNPADLDPYDQAQAEVSGLIDKIAELTDADPEQQQRIPALRQLTQEKLQFAKKVIGLQENGNHRAAMAAVNTHFGKEKMDDLRQLIADMQAYEDRLLEARI